MKLTLPYPPTVNTYWRHCKGRTFISERGKKYQTEVFIRCRVEKAMVQFKDTDRLSVSAIAYPPDHRTRDLDNLWKGVLDSIQQSGVYGDDSQIDKLLIERGEIRKGGEFTINIEKMG